MRVETVYRPGEPVGMVVADRAARTLCAHVQLFSDRRHRVVGVGIEESLSYCEDTLFPLRLRYGLIIAMQSFASKGSQRWLQAAVNRRPQLLLSALQRSGAIAPRASVAWCSPLEKENFREYRDWTALEKVGVLKANLKQRLEQFWPARGPVWDALGITSEGHPLFIEAKAHIAEAASPATKASSRTSLDLIERSLKEARRFYAPKATACWSNVFYQYANRLAHHYLLKQVNDVQSRLVFLYFVNADDVLGPTTEEEWHGAVRLIHAVLGLPKELTSSGVFDAFLDARLLRDSVDSN